MQGGIRLCYEERNYQSLKRAGDDAKCYPENGTYNFIVLTQIKPLNTVCQSVLRCVRSGMR
jgi:hypothetical protein